jgi:superfamily II DNA/RNA helicase
MLDMGFRPPVDRIVAQCPRDRQTLFFSATLDGEAGKVARQYTSNAKQHEHLPTVQRVADVEHRFVAVERDDRIRALVTELRGERDRTLVFVRTKRGADRLVKRLGNEGVNAVAMHGDKSQSQRERALARFQSGNVDTLVATDVAARGIDVSGISHVINFDPPEDREGYVHRIGRTARAGRTGVGITFVGAEQAHDVGRIAADLSLHGEFDSSGLTRSHTPAGGGAGRSQRNGRAQRNGRSQGGRPQRNGNGRGGQAGSSQNGSGPRKIASAGSRRGRR